MEKVDDDIYHICKEISHPGGAGGVFFVVNRSQSFSSIERVGDG
jgi:hypothetical protein